MGSTSHALPTVADGDDYAHSRVALSLSQLLNPVDSDMAGTPDVYLGLPHGHDDIVEEEGQLANSPIHFRELETFFNEAYEASIAGRENEPMISPSPLSRFIAEIITTRPLESSDDEGYISSSDTETGDSDGPHWSEELSPAAAWHAYSASCLHQVGAADNHSTPSPSPSHPSPSSLPTLRPTPPASTRTRPPPPPPRRAHLGHESSSQGISATHNIEDNEHVKVGPEDHQTTSAVTLAPSRVSFPRPASAPSYISRPGMDSNTEHMLDHISNRPHIHCCSCFCACLCSCCLLRRGTITPVVSTSHHENHNAVTDQQHEQIDNAAVNNQQPCKKKKNTEKAKKMAVKKMAAIKKTYHILCKKSKAMKKKMATAFSQQKIDLYCKCLETIADIFCEMESAYST
ncbi:hypothetical protein V8F06_004538 [Rhypophila decipiens]